MLERTKTVRSLACPIGEDFSQLDLCVLQQIAQRTNRLRRNWDRSNPRIIGAVKAVRVGGEGHLSILAVLPGTDMLLLYAGRSTQRLVCSDLQTGMPSAGLHVGDIVLQAQYDERGKHLIAMIIRIAVDE